LLSVGDGVLGKRLLSEVPRMATWICQATRNAVAGPNVRRCAAWLPPRCLPPDRRLWRLATAPRRPRLARVDAPLSVGAPLPHDAHPSASDATRRSPGSLPIDVPREEGRRLAHTVRSRTRSTTCCSPSE